MVLQLLEQILAQADERLGNDVCWRLCGLFAEASSAFETVAERMHGQANERGYAIDVELCTQLAECRTKLAVRGPRCASAQPVTATT